MAQKVRSQGSVVGIERGSEQLAEALRQARQADEQDLVEFRQGDVHSPPLEKDEDVRSGPRTFSAGASGRPFASSSKHGAFASSWA
jgi:hypothetical protein